MASLALRRGTICVRGIESAREARTMEFTIACPNDGSVNVSLEDIDTVVLREPERAEVVFTCPVCGEPITVHVVVPGFLVATIEAMAEEGEGFAGAIAGLVELASDQSRVEIEAVEATDEHVTEAYCEYFRRQLAEVACVEDMLAEIDAER
jgi:hypothetical protein